MTSKLIQIRFTADELQILLNLVQHELDTKDGAPLLPIATKLLDAQADLDDRQALARQAEERRAAAVTAALDKPSYYTVFRPDGSAVNVTIPENEDK